MCLDGCVLAIINLNNTKVNTQYALINVHAQVSMNMHKLAVDTAVVSVRKFEKGRAIFTPPSKQSPPLYYESLS